jgi:hypothetical protein
MKTTFDLPVPDMRTPVKLPKSHNHPDLGPVVQLERVMSALALRGIKYEVEHSSAPKPPIGYMRVTKGGGAYIPIEEIAQLPEVKEMQRQASEIINKYHNDDIEQRVQRTVAEIEIAIKDQVKDYCCCGHCLKRMVEQKITPIITKAIRGEA